MAYVLQLDTLDRQAQPLVMGALVARANGSDVEVPDMSQMRVDFDRALAEHPQRIDPRQHELLQALGLRE